MVEMLAGLVVVLFQSAGDTGEEKKTEANDKRKDLGMSDDEVVAVLGHELGHWALYHSICNLVIAEVGCSDFFPTVLVIMFFF